jgi:hypothetical protein
LANLNEIGFQDERLNYIFDNDLDFYEYYLIERIPALQIQNDKIEEEQKQKQRFSRQMVLVILTKKKTMIEIYFIANQFLRNYKKTKL